MIRFLIFCVASFLSIHSYSQDWIRIYGQGLDANAYYIIESYDHGYIIEAQIQNGKYLWIFKTDINGEILWDKKIGTGQLSLSFSPMNIEQTLDNGYIISGSTTKYGSFDAFIIKLNVCAEIEWCNVLITPTNFDEGFSVKVTPEGDYVLLGGYFLTDPYSNVSLFKFNSSGDLIWHQFYPMDSVYYDDQPADLMVDNDGYLIVSGRYYSDPRFASPAWIHHYFLKADTAGNQAWELVYGANDRFYGWPSMLKKSNTGNYYEAGNQVVPSIGHVPAFVKVMHGGSQSYHSTLMSGTLHGGLSSIDFLYDSVIVTVGGWTINDTTHDAFFKTDTLGNVKKIKDIIRVSNSYISTTKSFDNKFITIGNDATGATWKIYAVKVNSDLDYDSIYTQPFTYDSLCPYPIVSDTVDPDCDNVYVGIDEPFKNPETTKLKVYPNPAKDFLTIEMPKYLVVNNTTSKIPSTTIYHMWGSAILEIYDMFGNKLFDKEVVRSETTLTIDVSGWPGGMYFCRLVFNKQTVANSKVIVE